MVGVFVYVLCGGFCLFFSCSLALYDTARLHLSYHLSSKSTHSLLKISRSSDFPYRSVSELFVFPKFCQICTISLFIFPHLHCFTSERWQLKMQMQPTNEPRQEKTNILVPDLVRHKPGYTATGDG